jgi:UTP:GlnB (protein PII) uridylyltransferase
VLAAVHLLDAGSPAAARIKTAPPPYVLSQGASDLARHAALLASVPGPRDVRVAITPGRSADQWLLDVGARDRPGLMAAITGVIADMDIEVVQAVAATWDDGAALEAFVVRASRHPEVNDLQDRLVSALGRPLSSPPIAHAQLTLDNTSSPVYTACHARSPDRPGLLHAFAVAIASAGANVHAARVTTVDGVAHDRFDLTERSGAKVRAATEHAIRTAVLTGVKPSLATARLTAARLAAARLAAARLAGP